MAFQIKAKVVYNKRIKGAYFHCALVARRIAQAARPGQFVNIKPGDDFVPLLRRPFGIHRVSGSKIEILYEALGQGTRLLSQKKTGDFLDVIGPLGNGFNLPPITYHLSPILVAGGMGVAPLIFLAQRLAGLRHKAGGQAPSNVAEKCKIVVLIGAKTRSQILCEKDFKRLGCGVKISTDDGSGGLKGKVTDLLKRLLPITDYGLPITIYACGPKPMLKEIALISKKYKIPAQISLEEHLSCGLGACFGCPVNTREGFKRVCKEGPVFNADEIVWGDTR